MDNGEWKMANFLFSIFISLRNALAFLPLCANFAVSRTKLKQDMEIQANYIRRIEIDGLWHRYNVAWDLRTAPWDSWSTAPRAR